MSKMVKRRLMYFGTVCLAAILVFAVWMQVDTFLNYDFNRVEVIGKVMVQETSPINSFVPYGVVTYKDVNEKDVTYTEIVNETGFPYRDVGDKLYWNTHNGKASSIPWNNATLIVVLGLTALIIAGMIATLTTISDRMGW